MTAVSIHEAEAFGAQVALLHRISSIVSSELSLDEMLGEILGTTVQVAGCDACLVYLHEKGTGEIVLRASQLPHAKALGKLRMKIGEGVTGWVAAQQAVVVLSAHAGQDPRFKKFPSLIEDTYEAFISVPLVSGGDIVGVINVHYRQPQEYSPDLIAMLTFIGEQMGGAVAKSVLAEDNRRLQEEASEMKRQLEARKLVERAKGILMQRYTLTEEEAYLRLRNDSRRSRRAMRELAEHIIQQELRLRQKESEPAAVTPLPQVPAS
ncbi:MAG TPA: GAF domain-containing protein [Bryobacteraceae bacterium]|nr:GAF domain-containing protein [Bryobacteraceae bacterium]